MKEHKKLKFLNKVTDMNQEDVDGVAAQNLLASQGGLVAQFSKIDLFTIALSNLYKCAKNSVLLSKRAYFYLFFTKLYSQIRFIISSKKLHSIY